MCSDKKSQAADGVPQDADLTRRIRERAHLLWEAEGCPEGRDQEYWHRAEELIEDEAKSAYPPAQSRGLRS